MKMSRLLALPLALVLALFAPILATAQQECTGQKIPICHHPPGNPENAQSICIAESAWPAHEAHGDTMGFCEGAIACGEPAQLGEGMLEMQVVATGFMMTGPFVVDSEGPVTLDPFTCAAVDSEKWSCAWRGMGDPGFDGPQSITVRFDQKHGDSVECFIDEEAGLPVELVEASVE